MRIAFVHTALTSLEYFRADMLNQHPHVDCFHLLNEGLVQDLARGEERQGVYRRAVTQLLLAADNRADLIVLTCSSLSPTVDMARLISPVPIVKMDDPMAAEAVRIGQRIAVLCTNTIMPGPCAGLLRQHAAAQGRKILVETVVCAEAQTALFAGDQARHDAIVMSAARDVAGRFDVLVLVQTMLGHLQGALREAGTPVLFSPPLLMADLARRLAPPRATG